MADAASDEFFEPEMPPIGEAGYLLRHFWKVGPTVGEGAITSGELRSYQENQGIQLSPWECNTLRQLSIDYSNETHRARDPDCPPPFGDSPDAARLKQAEMHRNLDLFLA